MNNKILPLQQIYAPPMLRKMPKSEYGSSRFYGDLTKPLSPSKTVKKKLQAKLAVLLTYSKFWGTVAKPTCQEAIAGQTCSTVDILQVLGYYSKCARCDLVVQAKSMCQKSMANTRVHIPSVTRRHTHTHTHTFGVVCTKFVLDVVTVYQ